MDIRLALAADYYNNLRLQVGDEVAMTHTLQRFDADPRAVRVAACHEGVLPADDEIPGTVAW